MSADLALALPGGVTLVAPDDLSVATTYVLQEQGDWFEDEIRFLRVLAKPAMRAVDVGANFGVYTLTLAHAVGPAGRVWAIEPGGEAARCLAQSIAANHFNNVELVACALSRGDGRGHLDAAAPELRRLTRDAAGSAVELRSLDSLAAERGIARIDFVKIDVEGEEAAVLEGAAAFLARETPLLMVEFWGDRKFNVDIFTPLYRGGHDCFRLVPGINVLAPFYEAEEPDAYQLNLFACRAPRAHRLADAGQLIIDLPKTAPALASEPDLAALYAQPYAREHAQHWRECVRDARHGSAEAQHFAALRSFLAAQDRGNSAEARYWALEQAYAWLHELIDTHYTPARGASFVRVAAAFGRRAEAVAASRRLATAALADGEEAFAEPFLAPWPWQESIAPGAHPARWLLAAAVESFEHLFQFSSGDRDALAPEILAVDVDRALLSPAYARREQVFLRRRQAAS